MPLRNAMQYWEAIVLGIVQGLTEFLPVSSTGHLVLAETLLGVGNPDDNVLFKVLLHFGTLLSVLLFFRKRLWDLTRAVFNPEMKDERKMIFYLFIGTVPAVLAALTLKDPIRNALGSPLITCCMLIVTGILLLLPPYIKKLKAQQTEQDLSLKRSLFIGAFQALALLPGISRSGSTIVAGMIAGIKPSLAAEFSFLLSIPAIVGGIVFEAKAIFDLEASLAGPYAVGTLAAFLMGLTAVYTVLTTIRKGKFQYFAYYCLLVGFFGVFYFYGKA
ncbi:MAG: undecaprenyl-diphosphate phosphatase, partial [Verrucomicrobiota bacterium]